MTMEVIMMVNSKQVLKNWIWHCWKLSPYTSCLQTAPLWPLSCLLLRSVPSASWKVRTLIITILLIDCRNSLTGVWSSEEPLQKDLVTFPARPPSRLDVQISGPARFPWVIMRRNLSIFIYPGFYIYQGASSPWNCRFFSLRY